MNLDELIAKRKEVWEYTHNLETDKKLRYSICKQVLSDKVLLSELLRNPDKLIPLQFIIVDKDKHTVPFFPNGVQDFVINKIKQGKRDFLVGKRNTLKFRCLKGRQQGITAIITAYQLALTILTKNFSGFTMADSGDNAKVILNDKGKYPYRNLPASIKPHEKFNSANEIFFDNLNSSWRIASAESGEAGRSRTISFFHGSEVGFWTNYSGIAAALNPAITADAIVFEETTANGHNDFYDNWFDVETDFENIFIPWWLTTEYKLNFENEDIEKQFKEDVENAINPFYTKVKLLRDKEGLDWNQLYWYNGKRKALKEKLEQEYPCTEQEAFLFSGRPYFDRESIEQKLIELKDVVPVESLHGGSIIIYEKPIEGERYYGGADVAEGLAEGDSSHYSIFKASTAEQVAFIHGKFSTDRFGDVIVKYSKMYNNCYAGIENNNHGHAVLNTVYITHSYKNVHIAYETNRAAEKKNRSKKLGWTTTEASKYIMLDELDSALRDKDINIKDIEFYKEAHKVSADDKGKVSINGKDRVAANAIAWQMRKYHYRQNNVAQYYAKLAQKRAESNLKLVN